MTRIVGEYKITKQITEDDIESVIVGVLESGYSPWLQLDNTGEEWKGKPKDEPLSLWAAHLLCNGRSLEFIDLVSDEEDTYLLDLAKLIRGIELNHINRPFHEDLENSDAITCDCIIQYALFGEVRYG